MGTAILVGLASECRLFVRRDFLTLGLLGLGFVDNVGYMYIVGIEWSVYKMHSTIMQGTSSSQLQFLNYLGCIYRRLFGQEFEFHVKALLNLVWVLNDGHQVNRGLNLIKLDYLDQSLLETLVRQYYRCHGSLESSSQLDD
jgi:hypothetical protein